MEPSHQKIIGHIFDTLSATAIIGTIVGALPAFAAIAGILWYGVQIWESKTVQKHVRRRRLRHRAARMAALKTELKQLENPEPEA